jgi:hypothetical protein
LAIFFYEKTIDVLNIEDKLKIRTRSLSNCDQFYYFDVIEIYIIIDDEYERFAKHNDDFKLRNYGLDLNSKYILGKKTKYIIATLPKDIPKYKLLIEKINKQINNINLHSITKRDNKTSKQLSKHINKTIGYLESLELKYGVNKNEL